MNFAIFLSRWFLGFGYLLDGLIIIFTLGYGHSRFALMLANRYSKKRSEYMLTNDMKQRFYEALEEQKN